MAKTVTQTISLDKKAHPSRRRAPSSLRARLRRTRQGERRLITYLKNFGLQFAQTQLVVTIVALPILISWGLGISVMTFLGNLLFAPILTIFLILSSLLLFTQLCNIPNSILADMLDYFTHLWDMILKTGSHDWIVSFAHPGKIILIIIPIILVCVLTNNKINTHTKRVTVLSIILGVNILGLIGYQKLYVEKISQKICYQEKLTITYDTNSTDKTLIITDDGFFGRKKTAAKTVAFEIKPYLTKTYGMMPITEIKLLHAEPGSFAAACELCATCTVRKISLPDIQNNNKKLSAFGLKKYLELQGILRDKNIVCEKK